MRSNLKAGKTAFTFRNRGQFPHNFTVVATLGGGKAFKTATIQPGKTLQKSVNLKPGAYVAVCTVFNGGHLAQGMEKTFTVGTFDQQKGTWGPLRSMVARAGRAGPRSIRHPSTAADGRPAALDRLPVRRVPSPPCRPAGGGSEEENEGARAQGGADRWNGDRAVARRARPGAGSARAPVHRAGRGPAGARGGRRVRPGLRRRR